MKYNKKLLRILLLGIIIIIASFLRIWRVGIVPPALTWDEVSIGYNAYSILKTGRDEHGKLLPLDTFTAYGDYKPPLSIYATVPAVALFGLNEFAVRLPSVIAGVLTVFVMFFLVSELFIGVGALPFIVSALIAISPWHIQLSRAGFEANIALLFITIGVTFVLKARHEARYWMVALLSFVAAIYTFNSARYFSPLLGLGLLLYAKPLNKKSLTWLALSIVAATITLLPIVPHLVSKEARLRFEEVNIFTDPSVVLKSNERIEEDNHSLASRLFHNRRVGYVRSYLTHFFDHFDPQFLFIRGDGNPKFSIQDVGQLYMIEFPFLIIGAYWVLANHKKQGLLLLLWLVTAIIPAAVARETPHALRIENSLPVWYVFIASGILGFLDVMKKRTSRQIVVVFIIILYGLNGSYYLHNYYVHYPREFSGEWQYGYREAIAYIEPIKSHYDRIYMTESIGRPYMYVLFYEQVDPQEFRKSVKSYFDAAGFYHVSGFDSYEFVGNESPEFKKNSLYIMPPGTGPDGVKILTTIFKLNGDPVLEIFEL